MKKLFLAAVLMMFSAEAMAALGSEFTVYGNVYSYNNTSGTALTPNSFMALNVYRQGVAGEVGHQNNGESPVYPAKIYAANTGNGDPAYYFTDIQNHWTTNVSPGQVIFAVVEAYPPENGWAGGSYAGCVRVDFWHPTAAAAALPDCAIREIPAPVIAEETASYIKVTFTGMDADFLSGYSIYRKTAPSGDYVFITRVAQARNSEVSFMDYSGLTAGTGYIYQVAANFLWGGGGGAPGCFETHARSAPSGEGHLACTPTCTFTMTQTPLFTPTYTATQTPAYTATPTATPGLPQFSAGSAELQRNLLVHRFIITENPVKNRIIKASFFSVYPGQARLCIYNVAGELAGQYSFSASAGVNGISRDAGNLSPGIYVLCLTVDTKEGLTKFPVLKIAVIR